MAFYIGFSPAARFMLGLSMSLILLSRVSLRAVLTAETLLIPHQTSSPESPAQATLPRRLLALHRADLTGRRASSHFPPASS